MPDAAGLGAAICASVGVGVHPDWETATAAMVRPGVAFAPDPGRSAAYHHLAGTYSRLDELAEPLLAWTSRRAASTPAQWVGDSHG